MASISLASHGRFAGWAIISPRLMSISSSRQIATDCGGNACSTSSPAATIRSTRGWSCPRAARSLHRLPAPRQTPPRRRSLGSPGCGRSTYCTGNRKSIRFWSLAMWTVSRCESSGRARHTTAYSRCGSTTLSPQNALIGMNITSRAGSLAQNSRYSSHISLNTACE